MKPISTLRLSANRLSLIGLMAVLVLPAVSRADSKSKNPTSKFYVANMTGEAELNTGEKIEELNDKSVFSAEGTVIETKKDSTNSIVLSNGTGIYLDSDTRLEVKRFMQEPFQPDRTDLETEPSISHTKSYLPRGTVGLCTSKLVAGSTMTYSTPLVDVSIRGQKVVIQSTDDESVVSLIAGDVTLRGQGFSGGEPLSPGYQAVISRIALNQPPKIIIRPIPEESIAGLGEKVSQACMARRTVYFDIAERQSEKQNEPPEIIVTEVTPINPDDIGPVISVSSLKTK